MNQRKKTELSFLLSRAHAKQKKLEEQPSRKMIRIKFLKRESNGLVTNDFGVKSTDFRLFADRIKTNQHVPFAFPAKKNDELFFLSDVMTRNSSFL